MMIAVRGTCLKKALSIALSLVLTGYLALIAVLLVRSHKRDRGRKTCLIQSPLQEISNVSRDGRLKKKVSREDMEKPSGGV